jgi:Na+-transporting NADH:ubiquinone oxidoreductase subunit NqrB
MLPFQDARIYQICFLLLFLLVGMGTRDWSLQPGMIGVAIGTCLLTQLLAEQIMSRVSPPAIEDSNRKPQTAKFPPSSLLSALITALGLSLLLRADYYGTMEIAASLAILSKFLLRARGKHLFNPANFGIIAALLLTPDAWVSPGQWGTENWYALLFFSTGGLVLNRVGRWDTTVAFLGTYAGLEAARNLWLGWTWDVWVHRLMSGSLLLFALFMITDPRTIPNARSGRILWAIAIGFLTFGLRNLCFLPTAMFWALFALAPLGWLLDLCLPADRFNWSA